MNKNILLGCHVGMGSPNYFLGSVKEAISYGANTFMFYTGAPQNSFRKPINELLIEEGKELLAKAGIDVTKLIVHAPYIINPANKNRPDLYHNSKEFIISELRRTYAFGAKILVLHPGAHVGYGSEEAIQSLAEALDYIFENDGTDVKIAIETMAGKGTEIGISFEEISEIISNCRYKNRLGVCLDTCHINDAGYNVHDVDSVLETFDKVIGLDKLLVCHLNDSKNPVGAHKDRHENIGYGEIGFETISKYVHHPLLINIPKILETPYIDGKAPYKKEIEMLLSNKLIDNWKENF